jgi:predicted transcriptional regulator
MTNNLAIESQIDLYTEEEIGNNTLNEVNKIVNINKSYKASRDFIIKGNYNSKEKIQFLNILESLYISKPSAKVKTSDYDNKPYLITFFNDFLDFLINSDFSKNELKVCLAIYSILEENNTYGNILISANNEILSKKSGIDKSNISKVIKTLIKKGFMKKSNEGALFLNYNFFYRGSKVDYDRFTQKYNNNNNGE